MDQEQNKNNMMPMIVGGALLLVVVVGVFMFANNQSTTPDTDSMMENEGAMMEGEDAMMEDETMMEDNGAMMEDDDAMMAEDAGMIDVEGGLFYFEPDEIVVEAGEEVTVTLTSVEGNHDFVVDELDVATEVISAGDTTTVTFTPDAPGEYEFYCSVGNHREMGMVGTLIVE